MKLPNVTKNYFTKCHTHGQNICRLYLHFFDLSEQLSNFKKIPEKLGIDGKSLAGHHKAKFRQLCWKITKNLLF